MVEKGTITSVAPTLTGFQKIKHQASTSSISKSKLVRIIQELPLECYKFPRSNV